MRGCVRMWMGGDGWNGSCRRWRERTGETRAITGRRVEHECEYECECEYDLVEGRRGEPDGRLNGGVDKKMRTKYTFARWRSVDPLDGVAGRRWKH